MNDKTKAGIVLIGIILIIVIAAVGMKLRNKKNIKLFEEGDFKYAMFYVDRGKFSDGIQTIIENVDFAMPTWNYKDKTYSYYIDEGKREFYVRIERLPISPFKKGRVRPFHETFVLEVDSKYDYYMTYDFDEKKLHIKKELKPVL